jgi:cytidylate kinase
VAQVRVWREDPTGVRSTEDLMLSEEAALNLVQHAIHSACEAGNVLIIGRGGQALLQNEPGVLHVRIEAPVEDRIQRVKERFKGSRRLFQADIEIRRAAQDWITERDQASEDYLRRYYGIDWADSHLYHVILNTGKLTIEQAAHIIVDLARQMEREAHPAQTAV